jgi:hypothetical protein
VRKQKGKGQSKFTDRDWGLVMHIFKGQKKSAADALDFFSKLAAQLDQIGETSLADGIDDFLETV